MIPKQPSPMPDPKLNKRYYFLGDGGKVVVLAFAAFLLSFAVAVFVYATRPTVHSDLCDYPSPREILTHVDGDQPSVRMNGVVVERAVRCVSGKDPIQVLTFRNFRRLGECTTNCLVTDLQGEKQIRPPGSISSDVTVQLSPRVGPGTWQLEGFDQAPSTGEIRTWFSVPFEVLP